MTTKPSKKKAEEPIGRKKPTVILPEREELCRLNSLDIPVSAYRKLVILAANHQPMMKLHRYCATILTTHADQLKG